MRSFFISKISDTTKALPILDNIFDLMEDKRMKKDLNEKLEETWKVFKRKFLVILY